jgi:pimeloyl-ACP methyl ester carboxylesterase
VAVSETTTIFCLHFLGGSARSWNAMTIAMGPGVQCVPLDLPGFGDRAHEPGASVADIAGDVAKRIAAFRANRWWIAGHSMGAKVALAVARKAEDGAPELRGLAGVAVLAGSPPAPEPIGEKKRAEMMAWIDGSDAMRRSSARDYIRSNVGEALAGAEEDRAVTDVLKANPDAWKAWLTQGSREDWSKAIGVLRTPALILSGSRDQALGPEVQERQMSPHFAQCRHLVLQDAGHLLPLEKPDAVAKHLRDAILST